MKDRIQASVEGTAAEVLERTSRIEAGDATEYAAAIKQQDAEKDIDLHGRHRTSPSIPMPHFPAS